MNSKNSLKENVRIGVITDGTPVKEDILASGMLRVNARLFSALSKNISFIASTNYCNSYESQDIAESVKNKTFLISFPRLVLRILGKIYPKIWDEETAFRFLFPLIVKGFRQSHANWVFCSCGVNPIALRRGARLAQAIGLPLAIYMVDDFFEGAILAEHGEHINIAKQEVPHWLSSAKEIFVISEGLRDHLKNRYKLNSTVLPLPYSIPNISQETLARDYKKQIIFVGSLSHFYIDGLRQIATALDNLSHQEGIKIDLRLTSSEIEYARIKIGNFECLKCQPCPTSRELYEEIASSLACFLPYSFNFRYKGMVSTSFPSKLLDYLAVGRYILVYAPEYATSTNYFKQYNLPEVLDVESISQLQDIILKQLSNPQNYSHFYRSTLHNNHSFERIRSQILQILNFQSKDVCSR